METVDGCMSTIFPTSTFPTALRSGPLAAAQPRRISNCRMKVMRSLGRNFVGRDAGAFADRCGFGFGRTLTGFAGAEEARGPIVPTGSFFGGWLVVVSGTDVASAVLCCIANLLLMFG